MIVGIDYGFGINQKNGGGRYAYELFNYLFEIDSKDTYIPIYKANESKRQLKYWGRFLANRILNVGLFTGADIVWEQFDVPRIIKENDIDVFHATTSIVPISCECKTVQTIHDLAFYYFSDYLNPLDYRYFKTWLKYSTKSADMVIAISQSTKNDLIKFWKIPNEKIRVIHHGVNPNFTHIGNEGDCDYISQKYNINGDYILFVGEINYRKNVVRLVQAFSMLKKNGVECKLVLVGTKGNAYDEVINNIDQLGLMKDVIFTGHVPMDDLYKLYREAKVFVFPSVYEGFGLPVIEAFASGTPVVTSNVSSFPEIVGDAGLMVDPLDTNELFNAIYDIMKNEILARDLIKKGIERAKMFSWKLAARETLNVYEDVLNL